MAEFTAAAPELTPAQRVMWSWALREAAPWRATKLDRLQAESGFAALSDKIPPMYVFHIADGGVTVRAKPSSMDERLAHVRGRAAAYRELLQEAVDLWCPDIEITLCASMDDLPHGGNALPTFAFQKRAGTPPLLLPDIDFLANGFYEAAHFHDRMAYGRKRSHAFFIGLFTGGIVTADTIEHLSLPRLAAAAHFHASPDVEFRMPIQGQFATPDIAARLAALPYCGGETAGWSEQFLNRFLISMDGNGATCSRVAIALRSNSVLLKYASPHMLYYFDGLAPWTHYIPIRTHDDISFVVTLERKAPGYFAHVARAGREFAENYLTRESIVFYTAALLNAYSACFTIASQPPAAVPEERPLDLLAHVQNHGDTMAQGDEWVGYPGSGRWIEGFSIGHGLNAPGAGLQYRGILPDGSVTPWLKAGRYCGTRGASQPLAGLCVRHLDDAGADGKRRVEARFIDGTSSGPVASGAPCASPTGSLLEAFRLTVA